MLIHFTIKLQILDMEDNETVIVSGFLIFIVPMPGPVNITFKLIISCHRKC